MMLAPKIEMHKHEGGEEKTLAVLCVGIRYGNGGCGARAKSGAHDVQVFACEASLLLQLAL